MMKYLILLFTLVLSLNSYSFEDVLANNTNKSIEQLYKENNVTGSILIESLDGKIKYQYNVNNERFVPASTFKIPNTLIILQEGLIKDLSEIITWDGTEHEYAAWNQDQTLKTAFQYSCVWCYQRYAKKVGHVKYHKYLKDFDYGNYLTGDDITQFWLTGDLKITVQEQIKFLRKLVAEDLPIQTKHIQTLKRIMLSKSDSKIKIWSKTGWSGKDGWYVGYLVTNNQTWFFANHLEIKQNSDLPLRKKLTLEAFKQLNIIQ
ncbi:hypothetical protein BTO11_12240 [Psychrosphaera saromensis]|uniref:Beta-lactamase n=2 Tax=Psychrosphaera saromensis TaxID=716813 RepID=A0A2S7UYL9_9GAMM|nr:hypothetical protein BTO11_12240 [Psychrosphaera saromensis]